jgi:hypothetical protein
MKRSFPSPGWAATRAEAQARTRLQHERALNCVIASWNPRLPSTEGGDGEAARDLIDAKNLLTERARAAGRS